MWHGDAQCRDCRVLSKLSECERHCDGSAIESLLEFKNGITNAYTAVFVSLMTYPVLEFWLGVVKGCDR